MVFRTFQDKTYAADVGQAQEKIPEFSGSGYTNGTCYVTPGYNGEKYTIVPCLPPEPPFDVPPVETDHDEPYDINAGHAVMEQGELITCNALSTTVTQCTKRVHMRVCADKSRFLLMSEDGKWHCLALGRQP